MDRAVYDRMAAQEDVHWWFAARRVILSTVIERLIDLPEAPRILEAGCGTGGNLAMLRHYGQVRAFERDPAARALAAEKSGLAVAPGTLPGPLPFGTERFDLVGLFDVLEHVEDDVGALEALRYRLGGTGRILLTVPAFPWLWSAHDVRHHHVRRYTRASLARTANDAGLTITHGFYFNSALFPLAIVTRAMKGLARSQSADDTLPGPLVNTALRAIFASERHLVGRCSLPFGLSLCAILAPRAP